MSLDHQNMDQVDAQHTEPGVLIFNINDGPIQVTLADLQEVKQMAMVWAENF